MCNAVFRKSLCVHVKCGLNNSLGLRAGTDPETGLILRFKRVPHLFPNTHRCPDLKLTFCSDLA